MTGALEHPNIIPIHALEQDASRAPLIVMKHVEGSVWQPGERSLDDNLDVLLEVCHAVHFAHSRGVMHRDLKPDNIMIGAFGEVYVLDWRLAAALDPKRAPELHIAAEVQHVAGTPQYLAPEMAAGDGSAIGVCSRVYLLGAILHECVVGDPPHQGGSIIEILGAGWKSPDTDLGADVPTELAVLCNQTAHAERERRPESAEALRQALLHYRAHPGFAQLAAQGSAGLKSLRQAAGKADSDANGRARAGALRCRSLRL